MRKYTLVHLSDEVLLRNLAELIARERVTTAEILAHIAEVDDRRLYIPYGYSSMHAYCVAELRLSDDAAYKRIQVARAGRQYPALFTALADGRLHLAGACLLAPHLTAGNLEPLVAAATYRRKSEIEALLARMFPQEEGAAKEAPATVRALPAIRPAAAVRAAIPPTSPVHTASPAHSATAGHTATPTHTAALDRPSLAPGQVGPEGGTGHLTLGETDPERKSDRGRAISSELAPGQVEAASSHPVPAERYLMRLTIGKDLYDKLRYAQALLSHAVPPGDVAQVLERALDALITRLETRKLGTGARPYTPRRPAGRSQYIPASVRRAVWERDKAQCTFVGANGHRCNTRRFLEFDHVDPRAPKDKPTAEGLRLRCRAHNQYEAERVFGASFMARKRTEARLERGEKRQEIQVSEMDHEGPGIPTPTST